MNQHTNYSTTTIPPPVISTRLQPSRTQLTPKKQGCGTQNRFWFHAPLSLKTTMVLIGHMGPETWR